MSKKNEKAKKQFEPTPFIILHIGSRRLSWDNPSAFFSGDVALIVGWAVTGPMFHFSDTWQLGD